MKKVLREMQTLWLHTDCSKVEPKTFPLPQNPFPGHGTAKIWPAGDGHYLYLQTQFGEDRYTQFRVIVVTDPQTYAAHPPVADRTDNNTASRAV